MKSTKTGKKGDTKGRRASDALRERLREARKRLLAAQENEARYRDFVNEAVVAILRVSPGGRILFGNPQLVRMLGYSSFKDIAAKNLGSFYHSDTPRDLLVQRLDRDGIVTGFEAKWKRRDGAVIHVRISSRAVKDSRGRLLYYEGTSEDITKEKEAEATLVQRLGFERLVCDISMQLVDLVPEEVDSGIKDALKNIGEFLGIDRCCVCVFSANKTKWHVSHEWCADGVESVLSGRVSMSVNEFRWSIGTIESKSSLRIADVGDLPKAAAAEKTLFESGLAKSLMCLPLVCGGQVAGWLSLEVVRSRKVFAEETVGLLKVLAEILADTIGRKTALTALERERLRAEALMDNIPDHIYFKDRKSRFIRINKSHAESFHLKDPLEAVGKTDRDFFSAEHSDETFREEQEIIRTGQPIVGKEERVVRHDGTVTWVSTTKAAMRDAKGQIVGTFGISRDITETKREQEARRKIEAKLLQTEKLESLGMLSSGIAHDFNNLLMGILGNAGLAMGEVSPGTGIWGYVKQIETIAMRAAELTNQMLAYAGKSKFMVEPMNLGVIIKEMKPLLEVSVSRKVRLRYDICEDIPQVHGDIAQVRQIIMNLVKNGSDAIGERDGKITVTIGAADCDRAYLSQCFVDGNLRPGKYVFLEVTDTGSGMDAATQARIFDPFFSTKSSTRSSGRGLGLANVLGIVRSHKGTLKVYSEVGKGTSFRILLPAAGKASGKTEGAAQQVTAWKGSGTVLVVDDDEVVRVVTEQILLSLGFSVRTATDGSSALKVLAESARETVAALVDLSVPGMADGGLLSRLRSIRKGLPIILTSGYGQEAATTGVSVPFDGFLQKPYNVHSLGCKMKEVLGSAR